MQIIIPDPCSGFRRLRTIIWLAGIIGVLQSLIWIGLAIIGITAYYCVFDKVNVTDTRLGSLTQQTFYHMYFGDCAAQADIVIDYTAIDKVVQKLDYHQINTWIWVYFGVHILWLISSISLLRKFDKRRLVLLTSTLLIWVLITLAISAMDLGLAILFGFDYGDLLSQAYSLTYEAQDATIILAAMSSSITMMIVSLRGFILWIVNVILLCYFFVQTFIISKATTNLAGQDNEGFQSETQSDILRQPIDAYSNTNGGPISSSYPAQLNVEPLKRATAMSVDTLLQRHYQRYPPDPDYSPQMVRSNTASSNQSNRPLKSALRNSRYQ